MGGRESIVISIRFRYMKYPETTHRGSLWSLRFRETDRINMRSSRSIALYRGCLINSGRRDNIDFVDDPETIRSRRTGEKGAY